MKSSRGSEPEVPERVIRRLSELLRATDLAEIEISVGELKVRVKAKEAQAVQVVSTASHPMTSLSMPTTPTYSRDKEVNADVHIIRSPFVGTFYRSPSPSSPVFVEKGQSISKGQIICIVEAMKIMNEIESDSSGIVDTIYVEDGTPVDFNAPLFSLRRS